MDKCNEYDSVPRSKADLSYKKQTRQRALSIPDLQPANASKGMLSLLQGSAMLYGTMRDQDPRKGQIRLTGTFVLELVRHDNNSDLVRELLPSKMLGQPHLDLLACTGRHTQAIMISQPINP